MQNNIALEVKELSKEYGKLKALNQITLDIYDGEIFGLIGPNGAGKSTFISILTTLCKPSSGDVYIKGISVKKQPQKVKPYLGFVPQDIALYPTLTGLDNLKFWAGIYGLSGELRNKRIEAVLNTVRLTEKANDRVDTYSGGMKRRLNIGVALLNNPQILIMDEPMVGVDIKSRRCILDALKVLKSEGKTIILTSHNIDDIESLCDRIAIIDKGVIKSIGTVSELLDTYGKENLEDILLELFDDHR